MLTRISVQVEPAVQTDVTALLTESDAVAARLYPGEYRRPITAESLSIPGTYVLIARLEGKAVGLCVLFDRSDHTVELKRMIVNHRVRGAGAGLALLHGAEGHALKLGAREMLLEVGTRNVEAQRLYRRGGYQECGPFAPYKQTAISLFMRRALIGKDA